MDKKEARKILGVSKEASRNDIERKYSFILLRQKEAAIRQHDRHSEDADESRDDREERDGNEGNSGKDAALPGNAEERQGYSFEQITEAYNVLMGYEVTMKEEPPSKAAPLLNKAGIDEKKAKNFFYYYKYHILGVIVAVIAIVLTVRSCVTRVDPDFTTAFIGQINFTETDKLKEMIRTEIPEIKEPGFDGAFVSEESSDAQMEYAMNMKAAVLFAAGDVDVFITDQPTFDRYAKEGAFLDLDEIARQLGVDMEKNKDYIVKIEEDSGEEDSESGTGDNTESGGQGEATAGADAGGEAAEEHLYGIDVSDSAALKEAGIAGEKMIVSIYVRCDQTEKAVKLLQFLMK